MARRTQSLAIAAFATAVLALAMGGTRALPARAHGAATSEHLYAPFSSGVLSASVRVSRTAHGYCWTSSGADARSDAYRCFVGNAIYDPCFSNSQAPNSFVVCPLYTPLSPVLRLRLTKPLPGEQDNTAPTKYPPWAIRLASGRWCELITGATSTVAGMRVSYGCSGGSILLGTPRRTSPTWTIFYARSYKASQFAAVAIRDAWW